MSVRPPELASTRRKGTALDAIDGVVPTEVARPDNIEELSNTLAEANAKNSAVVFWGNRSKIEWGVTPDRFDIGIELGGLPRILEHEASDLVVRASASVALAELQAELAMKGQRLAVDTVVRATTVGGMIGTGISGPLRYGFGAVRDLIIGATIVRADGVRATSGGRVVKNVAGYDLAKLYTGSYGTLGVVTEAYFRLHPAPEIQRYCLAECAIRDLADVISSLVHAQSAPSAIEVASVTDHVHVAIAVLVEGAGESVANRCATISHLLGPSARVIEMAPEWWGILPGQTTFKVTTEIASLTSLLEHVHGISQTRQIPLSVSGSAGVGVLYIGAEGLDTSGVEIDSLCRQLRAVAIDAGGSCTVLRAPTKVRSQLDVWGPIPALSVMREIKERFDPMNILAPGRFVGGI